MWVTTAGGAACLSLPGLLPLLHVPHHMTRSELSLPPHYVMPTVDDYYFISYVGYFFLYYLFVYLFNKNIFLMNYVKAQYE